MDQEQGFGCRGQCSLVVRFKLCGPRNGVQGRLRECLAGKAANEPAGYWIFAWLPAGTATV